MGIDIRLARPDDVWALARLERTADQAFRSIGMDVAAGDEVRSVEELLRYQRGGRAFVAEVEGRVAGFLLVDVVADAAHIEQVSVHPDHAGRRIGQRLIDATAEWALVHHLTALTLTTFRDVPWNAPYYERLGFVVVAGDDLPPALVAIRAAEAARGLDAWPRLTMRRTVTR